MDYANEQTDVAQERTDEMVLFEQIVRWGWPAWEQGVCFKPPLHEMADLMPIERLRAALHWRGQDEGQRKLWFRVWLTEPDGSSAKSGCR